MSDDFLKFDHDEINLDDFNFNINSTIPENELLELNNLDRTNNQLLNQENHNNYLNPNDILSTSHHDQSNDIYSNTDYLSPAASPYTNPSHISSFQPQSIQQSLSHSLSNSIQPQHQNSISGSLSTRKNSLYDPIDSIASPSSNLDSAYFSPQAKSIPLKHTLNDIRSPADSFTDALSPYSSFDPSSFKSPRSIGASPGPGSLPKSQLSKEEKLRRRREFHNQVERRRRDLIKEKIKELGMIVPPSLLYVDSDGKEVKASKSVIINKTVDYVEHLHKVLKEQDRRREILVRKVEELERLNGGSVSTSESPVPPPVAPPPPQQQHQQQQKSAITQDHRTPLEIPNIKSEDIATPGNLEFDVDEFLKEHNETWNHNV